MLYLFVGVAQTNLGQTQQAIDALSKAVEIDSQNQQAWKVNFKL